jgi:hypothetical protein
MRTGHWPLPHHNAHDIRAEIKSEMKNDSKDYAEQR